MLSGTIPPDVTISMLTATSVTVSWTQPELSFPVAGYSISLTRVTGSVLCGSVEDHRPTRAIGAVSSVEFSDLEEFSHYNVTVTAVFSMFTSDVESRNTIFLTDSASM